MTKELNLVPSINLDLTELSAELLQAASGGKGSGLDPNGGDDADSDRGGTIDPNGRV